MKKVLVLLVTVLLFNGCKDENFEKGNKAYENKDFITAKGFFEKSCDSGNVEACKNLGELYYWGRGIEQDREKSKPFFEKACNKKDGEACRSLGVIYGRFYEGGGGDYFTANKYFEKSCEYKHALGCVSLGYSYYAGKGVRQNLETAVEFYGKGCDLGEQDGCKRYKETNVKLFMKKAIENQINIDNFMQ